MLLLSLSLLLMTMTYQGMGFSWSIDWSFWMLSVSYGGGTYGADAEKQTQISVTYR